ncbi:IucA/IucC family protein [Enterovibrio nigricans]|uniref:IucA/IucC family protein n=1 Tax=Enterovibrio nigricans TaxID=504469 RepID=UPI0012FEEB58|nr:IucA/IucC family protein [Enterovibrio nigricans]
MSINAQETAEKASFQAFFNAYLKEVDAGTWSNEPRAELCWHGSTLNMSGAIVEVSLRHSSQSLLASIDYRTQVGCHSFKGVYLRSGEQLNCISFLEGQLQLIDSLYYASSGSTTQYKYEFIQRVLESHQLMARYISERWHDLSRRSLQFIDAEQALLFGHWQHPTPKSRQGMLGYHHQYYAPELKGQFKLHYFSVSRDLVRQRSAITVSAEDIINATLWIPSNVPADHVVLPMHPLQAQWLLHQDFVQSLMDQEKVIDLGAHGKRFTATSSVRSLYNADLQWMYKFSLPVKITNSLRVNKRAELDAGVVMATLYKKTGFGTLYPFSR